MPQPTYPNDLVFPVDGDGNYSDGSSTVSPIISLSSSFWSRAVPVSDFAGFSIIADVQDADSAKGTLSVWVTNADFSTRGDGTLSFNGPIIWVEKAASIINVGGDNAEPPFNIEVPFNCCHAIALRYVSQSGSGTLKAQLGGVGV